MRTTLTIEDDLAEALRAHMQRTGKSLKATVNDLIRQGLDPPGQRVKLPRFRVRARPLGRRPGLNYDKVSALVEQLEGPIAR